MVLYLRNMYWARDQGLGMWNFTLQMVSFLMEDRGLFSALATIILNWMDWENISILVFARVTRTFTWGLYFFQNLDFLQSSFQSRLATVTFISSQKVFCSCLLKKLRWMHSDFPHRNRQVSKYFPSGRISTQLLPSRKIIFRIVSFDSRKVHTITRSVSLYSVTVRFQKKAFVSPRNYLELESRVPPVSFSRQNIFSALPSLAIASLFISFTWWYLVMASVSLWQSLWSGFMCFWQSRSNSMYLGGLWTGLIRQEAISIGSVFSISLKVALFLSSLRIFCPLVNTLQQDTYILKKGQSVMSSEEISVFLQCHLDSTFFKKSNSLVLRSMMTSTLGNKIASCPASINPEETIGFWILSMIIFRSLMQFCSVAIHSFRTLCRCLEFFMAFFHLRTIFWNLQYLISPKLLLNGSSLIDDISNNNSIITLDLTYGNLT